MSAGRYVLHIDTNDDLEFAVHWGNKQTGEWYELSDVRMQVRRQIDDPEPLIEASVDGGQVTLGTEPDHIAWIVVPADSVADLVAGAAVYDVVATRASDGRVKTILRDRAVIREGVTR